MGMNYYKLNMSLGKFRAIKTEEIGNNDLYAEIYNDADNHTFSANIFTKGQQCDLEINGWTFSHHIEGDHNSAFTDFEINAIDPEGESISFYNTPYYHIYSMLSEVDVLCLFMDLIFIYSHFKNAEVAYKFNLLLRSLEYNEKSRRHKDEREITLEVLKTQAEFFKNYYLSHIDDCDDINFMKLIKESVNRAIDVVKENIEMYKIKD